MRSFWVLIILAIILILGWNSGFPLLFRASFVLAAGLVLSWLWVWWHLRGLEGSIEISNPRVQAGQGLEVKVLLRNRSLISKPWLLFKLKSNLPQLPLTKVVALSSRSARTFSFFIPCHRRGRFHLGPIVLTSRDPFGLFQRESTLGTQHDLLVYPKTVELAPSMQTAQIISGESPGLGLMEATPPVRGVRDYLPGDSYSRIHWPSTAKMRKLMSKDLERETPQDVWFLLDMEAGVQAGEDEESTLEYGVTVAASLCKSYLEANHPVALATWDRYLHIVPPGRGASQLWWILEILSIVSGQGKEPLATLIAQTEQHWESGSTLVIITPSAEESWLPALDTAIQHNDQQVALFLLDASTFDRKRPRLRPSPASDQVTRYSVRRGELWRLGLVTG